MCEIGCQSKNTFPSLSVKGRGEGLLHPKSIHLFFVYKDSYRWVSRIKCLWDYFKRRGPWTTAGRRKKPQCDRRVVKSGKEDQRETTKLQCAHFVLVSCNKLMYVGLILLVRTVFFQLFFFCDTWCLMFSARDFDT